MNKSANHARVKTLKYDCCLFSTIAFVIFLFSPIAVIKADTETDKSEIVLSGDGYSCSFPVPESLSGGKYIRGTKTGYKFNIANSEGRVSIIVVPVDGITQETLLQMLKSTNPNAGDPTKISKKRFCGYSIVSNNKSTYGGYVAKVLLYMDDEFLITIDANTGIKSSDEINKLLENIFTSLEKAKIVNP